MKHKLGFELHTAALLMKRAGDSCEEIRKDSELTGTHGYILAFLAQQGDHPVYQRDIETKFSIRRSSASAVLSLMERNGLVERVSVPHDARLKRIVMTEKGRQLHADTVRAFERLDKQALQGVSEEDLSTFFAVLSAIKRNLGCSICTDDIQR